MLPSELQSSKAHTSRGRWLACTRDTNVAPRNGKALCRGRHTEIRGDEADEEEEEDDDDAVASAAAAGAVAAMSATGLFDPIAESDEMAVVPVSSSSST
jgi:hypothetical protein